MNIADAWAGLTGLTVTYVLLASTLAWFVISSKGAWWLKITLITATIWFGLTLAYSVGNFMGWPSTEQIGNKKAQIVHFVVRHPSEKFNDPGAIYLWLRILQKDEQPKGFSLAQAVNPHRQFIYTDLRAPRAFALPYSQEMDKKLQELREEQEKKGSVGFIEEQLEDTDGSMTRENSNSQELRIIILQPNKLLPKD